MEEEQAEAVVQGNPSAALVVAGADALERLPDIEISTTERSVEPGPVQSVWQRYVLPALGALADVAAHEVLPRVLSGLSGGSATVPADESAPTRVSAAAGTGGHRHRHGRAGG